MNEYMEYLAKIIPEKDSLKLVKNEAEKYNRNQLSRNSGAKTVKV